jgi:hypothetical protein
MKYNGVKHFCTMLGHGYYPKVTRLLMNLIDFGKEQHRLDNTEGTCKLSDSLARELEADLNERQEACRQMGRDLCAIRFLECLELTDLHTHLEMRILLNEVAAHTSLKAIVLCQAKDCEGARATETLPEALCLLLQSQGTFIERVTLQEFKFLPERKLAYS